MESDSALIAQIKTGNRPAAEQLFERYERALFNYLLRVIGDRELAEDATQESFISAYRGINGYREEGRFRSWLFRIAHREAMGVLRRRGPNVVEFDQNQAAMLQDPGPSVPELVGHDQSMLQLERALVHLTRNEREVVLLRVSQDLPFKDIARVTGVPLNTALGRMHSATKKLRRWFDSQQVES